MNEETEDRPSKSQLKRDMHELQALGERLVELPAAQLKQLELPPALADAVDMARSITARGGRKRQLQYIGKLMRQVDPAPIRAVLARIDGDSQSERALLHQTERWRERLLTEGDTALQELFDRHPVADHQAMRQLVRNAVKSTKYQRELFRTLRDIFSQEV